jgi:hypothetical protein
LLAKGIARTASKSVATSTNLVFIGEV